MDIAVDIYLPIYSTCSSLVFSFLIDMTSNENLCAIVLDLVLGGWLNKPRSWFWRSAVVQISHSRSQNGRSCSTLPPCHGNDETRWNTSAPSRHCFSQSLCNRRGCLAQQWALEGHHLVVVPRRSLLSLGYSLSLGHSSPPFLDPPLDSPRRGQIGRK